MNMKLGSNSSSSLVAGGLLALVVCVTPAGSLVAGEESMMDAFQKYKAAWISQDVDAIVAFYGEDGTYTNPGTGKISSKAFAQWVGGLFTAIPDFKVQVVSADPIDENTLAEQWVITGTWKKPFPGGPLAGKKPTGKSFKVSGAEFQEWDDRELESVNAYYDQMTFLTQLGVIPPPGQKPQPSGK
jgi:steroid delta-isomerase-like uncharacterized protein